ncbi:endolytic transglycosylase MltG [Streptomyces sp. MST-110588]|uniref:endolytic transglycosylase MltG n=1 Tax=Streptomyces sp. MST-110588 TaxID=2833628 RepID=UPI001F5D8481|nr:endolytic transglycosylase MltG [Streptomyces sp. MST-110588]UNO40885.1 endolytic transglycosylase MltG [Streptomyces sp. MST-110588]
MSNVQHPVPRHGGRLTRRGWLVLLCAAAALVAVALTLLLGDDHARTSKLTVPEGQRASQVYAAVDKALDVDPGTTEKAARTTKLKLPAQAKGNPEGYLFPATYPIDDHTTPGSLLTFMVDTAHQRFAADGISAYDTVVTASVVQAEADTPQDMGKVARVIENRVAQGMPLQMDSTINYALDRSTLDTSHADTRTDSPYNTYNHQGLPPTPIGNPGQDALKAASAPPPGDWLYFVTVKPGDTRFTADYQEHQRNVREFNQRRGKAASGG